MIPIGLRAVGKPRGTLLRLDDDLWGAGGTGFSRADSALFSTGTEVWERAGLSCDGTASAIGAGLDMEGRGVIWGDCGVDMAGK